MRRPAIHYLRDNAGERTPHKVLVLDCEATSAGSERREVQSLRLWAARLVRRHGRELRGAPIQDFEGTTRAELAAAVLQAAVGSDTLWIFAHNLSYELALTRLPLDLLAAGYRLGRHNLASEAPWAYLGKGKAGIRLADSWSWLPQPVEKLGEIVRLAKVALPPESASDAAWMRRCKRDVEITAAAITGLMDEWDRRRLGWWSLTGPASGWNSMLHMHSGQRGAPWRAREATPEGKRPARRGARTLIDPDPAARAFERLALYSGRRDLWRVGKMPAGPWAELDLKTAHLAVAAYKSLPYRRWKAFEGLALDDWRIGSPVASVIARVLVETAEPRYPVRLDGAIVHPVGRFETVLAGPEIADARERGELLQVGPGYGYHLGPHMQEWATWALAVLASGPEAVDPLLRVAVKGWSKTVPGRWAMTVSREVERGPSHVREWELEPALVGTPPRRGYILHLAGEWSENVRDQEAEDSFPAVLAHIQSWTRLALGRLIDAVPEGCRAACNTEGLWVHAAAIRGLGQLGQRLRAFPDAPADPMGVALDALNLRTAPLEVRIKQTARTLRLLSPQHLQVDGERHYAGVPRSAVETGPQAFEFWTWPKLAGQIERGDPEGYVRELRRVDLSGLPVSRWAYSDGCCEPLEAAWSPEAGNAYKQPAGLCSRHSAPLRPLQHPALRRAVL